MSSDLTSADWLNQAELRRYLRRVGDRWPLERAYLGGARVADARGAGPQRERGAEYVVVLVSGHFDDVPWLERVHQCATLWDVREMRGEAELHCYTPTEFNRRVDLVAVVAETVGRGVDLLAPA